MHNRNLYSWAAALAVSAGLASFSSAEVTGTVKLAGKAPEAKTINVSGVADCAKQHADKPLTDESVVVGAGGGLANVVVSIKPEEGATLPEPKGGAAKGPAVLDQKGCQYSPHVLALQAGGELRVKNSDPFLHNVHTQPEKNEPINKAQPNLDPGMKVPAPKEVEYYHVKCDVHPWMSAWIAVIDNPYFAVTGADGTFKLPDGLPDGEYALTAWHEKFDPQAGKVTVKDGKGTVDFSFKAE